LFQRVFRVACLLFAFALIFCNLPQVHAETEGINNLLIVVLPSRTFCRTPLPNSCGLRHSTRIKELSGRTRVIDVLCGIRGRALGRFLRFQTVPNETLVLPIYVQGYGKSCVLRSGSESFMVF